MKNTVKVVLLLLTCCLGSARAELVGYWSLDGEVADRTGQTGEATRLEEGNGQVDAVFVEDVPSVLSGRNTRALYFDADNDDVFQTGVLTGQWGLDGNPDFTISCWIKGIEGEANNNPVIGMGNRESGGKIVRFGAHVGQQKYQATYWNGNTNTYANQGIYSPGVWNHVVLTYTTRHGLSRLWVNGADQTDAIGNPNNTLSLLADGKFLLGGYVANGDYKSYARGYVIADVALWNEVIPDRSIGFLAQGVAPDRIAAHTPAPAVGAEGVPTDTLLSWATSDVDTLADWSVTGHYLYIVPDEPNFAGVTPVTVVDSDGGQVEYGPLSLQPDKVYYWRVDQALNGSTEPNEMIPGKVWSFDTSTFPIVIADPVAVSAPEGGQAQLAATFEIKMPPQGFIWYKDGVVLAEGDGVSYRVEYDEASLQYTSYLTIADVDPNDYGRYACQAVKNANQKAMTAEAVLMVETLFAHWPMDGALTDAGFYQFDGQLVAPFDPNANPTAKYESGRFGQALRLYPIGYAVQLPGTETAFDDLGLFGFTVNAWVKTSTSAFACVLGKENQADQTGFVLNVRNSGEITHTLRPGGGATSSVKVNDDQWHMITSVYDAAAGEIRVYVDGAPRGRVDYTAGYAPSGKMAAIGIEDLDDTASIYNGLIDELQVWSYPQSDQEIAQRYLGITGQAPCAANPVYDITGPQGQPDCRVDVLDAVALLQVWLTDSAYPAMD